MQAMNMSIAQVSAFPPTGERHQRSAAETSPATRSATTASNDATRRDNSPREIPTAKITFDDAGFTVVRTIDVDTGDVVAQNPTEAYLRLAHAMIDVVKVEAADRSRTDVFA